MGKNKNWFIESTVEAGEVVINDGGSSVDFRIEGDTDANLLVTDGSTDKVGIGTNTPDTKLEVTSNTVGGLFTVSNHNVSSSMPAEMVFKKSRGSKLSPATMVDGDFIGKISWKGYDGSNYDELAYIDVSSASVSSDTSKMTIHADSIIFDGNTDLKFGTTGQAVSTISTEITANSLDTELPSAKAVYAALSGGALTLTASSEVGMTSVTSSANRYKIYYLSNHAGTGTFSPADVKTDGTYFHFGGATDTNYKLKVTGNSYFTGTVGVTGASTLIGALTVGVDDTGHDVKLFGATSGKYMLWDESADSLILGVDDTGVDFIAHGATANYKMHWDESADKLLLYGHAQLGYATANVITVKGTLTTSDDAEAIMVKAGTSSQSADIFQVYDEATTKSFYIEDTGETNVLDTLKIVNDGTITIAGDLQMQVSGSASIIDYNQAGGSNTFSLQTNGTERLGVDASNNITLAGVTDIWTSTTSLKSKSQKVIINSVGDSATSGVLEVAKVTTSSGGLTLDSAGGTVTVSDHLSITGDLTVSGTFNVSTTTSTSLHLASGGSNLGIKVLAQGAASTSPLNNVNKWIAPVDSTGNEGTAGIATRYISSDNDMYITTQDSADGIYISPNHNADDGTVYIGQTAGKGANLHVYNHATIVGNLTVSGSYTGTMSSSGTTNASFQIDSDTTGPKLTDVTGDSNALGVYTSADAATHIQATGLKTTTNYANSSAITIDSYAGAIDLTPYSSSTSNASSKVTIAGGLAVSGHATFDSSISGRGLKLGLATNSDYSTSLVIGDVVMYGAASRVYFDSSENCLDFVSANLYFGRSKSGSLTGYGKVAKFYGDDASSYMQWDGASNELRAYDNAGAGSTTLKVDRGSSQFGTASQDYSNVVMYGNQAAALFDCDSGTRTVTLGGGLIQAPTVSTTGTINLELYSPSNQFANLSGGHITYNLPVVATSGQRFKFMVSDFTGNLIVTCDGSETMVGGVIELEGDTNNVEDSGNVATLASTSSTSVTVTAPYEGSYMEFISNGTNWYVSGIVITDTATVFN